MKKLIIYAVALFLLIVPEMLKAENEIPKRSSYFDLAGGLGSGIYSGALSWSQTHGINQSNSFRIGYGIRYSLFGGSDLTYITAPANLTADEATIDTLILNKTMTMGLSLSIHLEYAFNSRWSAGFNIDALGLGFGPEQDAVFISSNTSNNFEADQKASPTSLNVLLVGDNDIGQLKSEFYASYALSETMRLRGGLDMTFSEYTTSQVLTHDNDRFRYKAMLFFVSLSFNPF